MNFVNWDDSYNLGIKEIDIQHRGLFDLINRLSNTRSYEHGEKYFFATANTLIDYALLHFKTEERYMEQAQYAKLVEHRKEHSDFISRFRNLIEDLEKDNSSTQQKILDFLNEWYMTHILGIDRDYVPSLKSKGFM
jgi:hemerythrin